MTISCKRDAPCEPGAGRPSIGVRACLLRATRAPDRLEVMASSTVPGGLTGPGSLRNVPWAPRPSGLCRGGPQGASAVGQVRRALTALLTLAVLAPPAQTAPVRMRVTATVDAAGRRAGPLWWGRADSALQPRRGRTTSPSRRVDPGGTRVGTTLRDRRRAARRSRRGDGEAARWEVLALVPPAGALRRRDAGRGAVVVAHQRRHGQAMWRRPGEAG